MINVAALTTGKNIPSSRFRIRQYIEPLRSLGIAVHDYCPFYDETMGFKKLLNIRKRYVPPLALAQFLLKGIARVPGIIATHASQITWIERNILPGFEFPVYLTKSPRVLDVDDAIWMSSFMSGTSAKTLARSVDVVIAGNTFLADWYSNYCHKVYVIPTAIDCHRFTPLQKTDVNTDKPFIVGWTGTSGNYKYLKMIEAPLKKFLLGHNNAYLLIVADKPPSNINIDGRIKFVEWTPEIESSILHSFDVGIMPLTDEDWARGKCSFKLLQYMASGLPVIASPVGMNKEVINDNENGFFANTSSEWVDSLETLFSDRSLCSRYGESGLKIARDRFSLESNAKLIATIFKTLSDNLC
ncbi:glycosyltransferase family 4 protein [Oryzomonas sagensis]|uniref:Glycosyltransferase family 4 protein n=1 Tax=Oryzomonas sagensis TaxID=2603857 RepID=A0ABQ6TR05_9BACT|nr:glycosyltransferase family 4 protein [Oryzomonas sagensis]KAB0671377.1 glycosyltransferase family 4 protein [Oryzomonas sagensis]